MKKLLVFLMIAMLMLTGCKKEQEHSILPEESYNIEGERVVLFCGEKNFPISFTVDGEQKIENGTYFYYDLNGKFGRDWNDSFYLYHQKKLELVDLKEYGSFGEQPYFATNGNWPLFLNPVHIEFSIKNQDQVDEKLINAGQKLLKQNQMEEEPLIITDIWFCDMDKDGSEEQFFKASNYTLSNKDKEGSVIKNDLALYSFLAYADGEDCQLLSGSFKKIMNEQEDEAASAILSSTTYDDEGNLATAVLKRRSSGALIQDLRPIIADPDGDQNWSIYLYKKGDFESLSLMDYIDGNFVKTFEIIF